MDIIERLKIAEETKKDAMGVGDFMKGTSVIQEAIYEIQSLRQQLTKPADEVLVEALRFYADKSSYDCDHDVGMEVSHRVILYKDQYEHNQSTYYAGRRAIEALATYDKLSEVNHDTK